MDVRAHKLSALFSRSCALTLSLHSSAEKVRTKWVPLPCYDYIITALIGGITMKYMSAEQAGKCGRFIKLPCAIFDSRLSPLAKLLYAYLLNLSTLSAKNGLSDERGVYVFCTILEAARMLSCCRDKAIDYFSELEQEQLIYRQHCGRGKPNRIYLVDSMKSTNEPVDSTESTHRIDKIDASSRQNPPEAVDVVDTNYTNTNYTDSNYTDCNKTASSPLLPESDQALLLKAKLDIRYFSRKAAGESEEQLEKEAYEHYLTMKKDPLQ